MKNILILALNGLLSIPAFAIYNPSWERPIKQAQMEIVEASGFLMNIKEVKITLNRRDGSEKPTSVRIEMKLPQFHKAIALNNKPRSMIYELPISDIVSDRCNGIEYVAQKSAETSDIQSQKTRSYELVLSSRKGADCNRALTQENLETYWEAEFRFIESGSQESESVLILEGNPESLMSAMSVQS